MDQNIPIEVIIEEIKTCITQYANGLCQQYQLPPVILIQILQEIVLENKVSVLSHAISQLKATNVKEMDIDLSTSDAIEKTE